MDFATLITTALATGAASSVKDTADQAVKDAYNGLKTLIQRKFANKPAAETALAEYEKQPDVWREPLKHIIKEAELDQDQKIIAAAQQLVQLVQPQQAAMGKYNVQITGNIQGYVQGDNQQVTINFSGFPEKH